MKLKVYLEPSIERDCQAIDFEDLGVSREEWDDLTEEYKKMLLYDHVSETIYGFITNIEEL